VGRTFLSDNIKKKLINQSKQPLENFQLALRVIGFVFGSSSVVSF
jgi:hypothetical protein